MTIYEKNINRLKVTSELIAKQIDKSKQPRWYEQKGRNFLIHQGDKVYPAYNFEELKKTLDNLKEKDFQKESLTTLVGIGNGEFLLKLLEIKEEKHLVLVIECELYLVKLFLEKNDVSEYMKNGSLVIIPGDRETVTSTFGLLESRIIVDNWLLANEQYILRLPKLYSETLVLARDIINQIKCNIGTVEGAGTTIAENDIKNLPYVIRHRGVAQLLNIFKGKPAVIVSTGPSLQKNIHILRQHQKKVIIIAVAQALRPLLANRIRPDFICTVDYCKTNAEHFEGLMDCGVPLIALNRSYAGILKRWKGPKFISTSDAVFPADTTCGYIARKGSLIQGGSVSHMALGTAILFGCEPIGIIGQDLAYEGNKSHVCGADASGNIKTDKNGMMVWDVNDPGSHLKDGSFPMGFAQPTESYFSNNIDPSFVQTNIGLMSFITAFEGILKAFKEKDIYNCTEGGARIKGADRISLRMFMRKKCSKIFNIDKSIIKKFSTLDDEYIKQIEDVVLLMESEMAEMEKVKEYSQKALSTDKKMKKKSNKRDSKKMRLLLDDNAKYSKDAHNLCKKNPLLGMHLYKHSRQLYKRELNVAGNNLIQNEKNLKIRIKRNEMIINAAKKSAELLYEIYEESLMILKEYLNTKVETLLQETEYEKLNIENWSKYWAIGNWVYPTVAAQQILKNKNHYELYEILESERVIEKTTQMVQKNTEEAEKNYDKRENLIQYNNLLDESKKIGTENKKLSKEIFKKSLVLIRKAIKLFPDMFPARWGLCTTLHHVGELQESADEYKKLIKDFPDNKRIRFEYGIVLLRIDTKMGFGELKSIMAETDKFDHFLLKLGDLYSQQGLKKDAIVSYKGYLNKYPESKEAKEKLEKLEGAVSEKVCC